MNALAKLLSETETGYLDSNETMSTVTDTLSRVEEEYIKENKTKVGFFKPNDSEGKKLARQIIAKWVGTLTSKQQVLTLPYVTWAMEKLIEMYTGYKFSYMACERDFTIFKEMILNGNKWGKKNDFYYGTLGDKIKMAIENQYSHLILDYCGMLSTFRREITMAVINNIVEVGGTISVTLLKARDNSHIIDKCYEASGESDSDNRTEIAIRHFFISLCNISDFEVVEELTYQTKVPMMLTVLKRTK